MRNDDVIDISKTIQTLLDAGFNSNDIGKAAVNIEAKKKREEEEKKKKAVDDVIDRLADAFIDYLTLTDTVPKYLKDNKNFKNITIRAIKETADECNFKDDKKMRNLDDIIKSFVGDL